MTDEGKALREERRARGLRQYELGTLVGYNASIISGVETGRSPIPPRLRQRLLELGFPISAKMPPPIATRRGQLVGTTHDGREVFRI